MEHNFEFEEADQVTFVPFFKSTKDQNQAKSSAKALKPEWQDNRDKSVKKIF